MKPPSKRVVAAVLVGVVVALGGLLTLLWLLVDGTSAQAPTQLELVRIALTVLLGTGGLFGLYLAYRRQRSTEIALQQKQQALIGFNLDRCVIGTAYFTEATFIGDALFRGTTFADDVWFNRATFADDVLFFDATFTSAAWFDKTSFVKHGVVRQGRLLGQGLVRRCHLHQSRGLRRRRAADRDPHGQR
ncbi:pentapeptide repeat protein [Actinokineospora cianjurensis]|uniref:Pentapeptide repeat protein n=2 Tax=Actinokineospora cianjurensis TaxID=585224 RepID=A0A421B6J4_9PSEU|nr:pentapeptide repeat protein [Actinokineospora cianjurensis]